MTHPLRASSVLCSLALAVPTYMASAQVIPSHVVPDAFGTLVMPSFAPALRPCFGKGDSLRDGATIGRGVEEITMLPVGSVAGGILVGLAQDGSGCAAGTLSSRSWESASSPEHVSVSMRCWNDLLSASDPWQPISGQEESSKRGPASHGRTRADSGTSEAFASAVTCTFTGPSPQSVP
jgi:hypothetical protein